MNKPIGFSKKKQDIKRKTSFEQEGIEHLEQEALKMLNKGRLDKAELIYKKMIKAGIEKIEIFSNLYRIYRKNDRFEEAIKIYRKLVKIESKVLNFTIDLSNYCIEKKRVDLAIKYTKEALDIDPQNVQLLSIYAKIMMDINELELSVKALKYALKFTNEPLPILSNLGFIMQDLNDYNASIGYYNQALKINPDSPIVLFNLASCFQEIGNIKSAIKLYNKSLDINPQNAEALYGLGTSFCLQNDLDMGINYLKKCLEIDSKHSGALSSLLKAEADICNWDSLNNYMDLINANEYMLNNISPFNFLSLEDAPKNHLKRSKFHSLSKYKTSQIKLKEIPKSKIRIGYFSSDFYNHATMQLMRRVFEYHDKDKFQIFVYSYNLYNDKLTEDLKNSVYAFRDIASLSDKAAAMLAREDQIDIAIDLKGHTRDSRLSLFSYRAAPIQISYLGYPGTTGCDFIDYLIADRVVIPPGNEIFYSEKIIYMPNSYQCNDDMKIIANLNLNKTDFNLPEEGFIFTCFNAGFKITKSEFDIWMQLLNAVNDSYLWLYSSNKIMEKNLRQEAKNRGVDPARIVFAEKLPLNQHLARHSLGDLFLDTFNYNAHTTASDALWAGMPLITVPGESFSSRVSASLLNALEVPELICSEKSDYFEKALHLANNQEKLIALKEKINRNKTSSLLFNSKRFTQDFEKELIQVLNEH